MTVDEFSVFLAGLRPELEAAVKLELKAQAEEVAKTAADMLGRYQPGWPPLAASTVAKHGDTPRLDTGADKGSITAEAVDSPGAIFAMSAGNTKPYAVFQELGAGATPPRPALLPALVSEADHLEKRLELGVSQAIGRLAGM